MKLAGFIALTISLSERAITVELDNDGLKKASKDSGHIDA